MENSQGKLQNIYQCDQSRCLTVPKKILPRLCVLKQFFAEREVPLASTPQKKDPFWFCTPVKRMFANDEVELLSSSPTVWKNFPVTMLDATHGYYWRSGLDLLGRSPRAPLQAPSGSTIFLEGRKVLANSRLLNCLFNVHFPLPHSSRIIPLPYWEDPHWTPLPYSLTIFIVSRGNLEKNWYSLPFADLAIMNWSFNKTHEKIIYSEGE